MKLNIKTTNIEMTQSIRDYLDKRLVAFEKFIQGEEAIMVDVEVGRTTRHHKQGDIFRAEINLHGKGHNLRAVSEKEDLYSAIDEARDEMVRELTAEKDKRTSLMRRGGLKLKNMLRGFGRKQREE